MGLVDLDSPAIRFLNLAADMILLGLVWFITSLPVITIGASSAAAYYVMTRRVSDREGYIIRDYFKAFKSNFIITTALFITLLAIAAVAYINLNNIEIFGNLGILVYPVNLALLIETIFVFIHVFPLASRFHLGYKELLKTALVMANKHLLTTILHGIILAAIVVLSMVYSFLLMFTVGVYYWISSKLLMRLYRKYRPDMDSD